MEIVLLTALGVGGATVLGSLLGFAFKNISHKFEDIVLGFAAGIMLSASITGLIIPSINSGGKNGVLVTVLGVICGAVCLNLIDRLVPHLHRLMGVEQEKHSDKNARLNKISLFVLAIAIHNLPEGIAAGVGFGSGNTSQAITVAAGIALQNIPEGMAIIAPMLSVGASKKRTFSIAAITGLIEVLGTFIGYFAVNLSEAILPFALSFAGGTMLYVISDEMIPETHSHGNERGATYAILIGFCIMMIMDFYIK